MQVENVRMKKHWITEKDLLENTQELGKGIDMKRYIVQITDKALADSRLWSS